MKKALSTVSFLLSFTLLFGIILVSTAFKNKEKVKIGFLIHDLVSERWKLDIGYFTNKVESLGGEVIVTNALGDARTQVNQGKMLIDEGVKVLTVVAQDGNALAELVDYANKKGTKIIAYDRMINNSNLHYYISFNSVKVGEMMAEYALKSKPSGNYVLLYGPSSDNNALLVKQGIMNTLGKSIKKGNIKVIEEKEFQSWYGFDAYVHMEEFFTTNKLPVDVIIASNDDLASGVIDALQGAGNYNPIITGQDASLEACKNILKGNQSMTMYKSIKKLSNEAATLSMKIANNDKVEVSAKINNGKHDVPSILFDPVTVDKSNLKKILVSEGHVTESDLQ